MKFFKKPAYAHYTFFKSKMNQGGKGESDANADNDASPINATG